MLLSLRYKDESIDQVSYSCSIGLKGFSVLFCCVRILSAGEKHRTSTATIPLKIKLHREENTNKWKYQTFIIIIKTWKNLPNLNAKAWNFKSVSI